MFVNMCDHHEGAMSARRQALPGKQRSRGEAAAAAHRSRIRADYSAFARPRPLVSFSTMLCGTALYSLGSIVKPARPCDIERSSVV